MDSNLNRAIVGGSISAAVGAAAAWLLGHLSGYEAQALMEAALPNVRALCNTVILASATILALLLTLLGISTNVNSKLRDDHYNHVKQIALLDTVLFVSSMTVFLILNIPFTKSDNVSSSWFTTIYYSVLGVSFLIGGGLISVVLMLQNTVKNIILIVGLGAEEHPLVAEEEAATAD